MTKTALIIGINGQDGTFLAKYLVSKNYLIYGIVNKKSKIDTNFILKQLVKDKHVKIFQTNILDLPALKELINHTKPTEIYYLATTHELITSISNYHEVTLINVSGLVNTLEIIREYHNRSKLFYASSSNVFASCKESPQSEKTETCPLTLYGAAKINAMHIINIYKKEFNLFACYGILYNHESILRKKSFLPMKIVDAVVNIKHGFQKKLFLGSLNDQRDWGWAFDYVKAMWLMLQNEIPENYVIGSGKLLNVKDILSYAFGHVNLNWEDYVIIDTSFVRDADKVTLLANTSKIKRELNWDTSKKFKDVITEMVDYKIKNRKF